MTPQDFIVKWQRANLSERSAAQSHFLDLCDLLGQPKPAAADPDGAFYTFERGVNKSDGGKGWADVWWREHFAWEYKGKHKDLTAAYKQLQLYREDLENPPLLVVCDLDRFEIHTNFTNTPKVVHAFNLAELAEPKNFDILRRVFTDPLSLKPRQTTKDITEEIAKQFAKLADGMRERGIPPARAAHFLMKLMFCMFAEDIDLLQGKLFSKILAGAKSEPKALSRKLENLFAAMTRGGEFGADTIKHFNGGLFADAEVVELTYGEIQVLVHANDQDWSNVEPSIFGTLFERTLDPAKRSQIGAHFTSKEDIVTLLEPVLMAPLRREWEAVKAKCDKLWVKVQEEARKTTGRRAKDSKARQEHDKLLDDFLHRLATVKVLDPACGSGNFLYVAINLLLDLEKQVITYGAHRDYSRLPHVRPTQLAGIEINPYAQQLAQVVIWIGYLQWMHHNGFVAPNDPVLEPIENIKQMDAIIDLSDPESPKEPEWPEAEFVVGNPPFLGGKRMRSELGDQYMEGLFKLWGERVPPEADLCCYWFEKARKQIEGQDSVRAGLLATQGIRGGANSAVLKRIKESGDLFFAESDRPWILDGAVVHVSMIGFDDGTEKIKLIDGRAVQSIGVRLSGSVALEKAVPISSNLGVSFMGITPAGEFDVDYLTGKSLLLSTNPHGRPSSDVIRPYFNGKDINQKPRNQWSIDFGVDMPIELAAHYEAPFEYLQKHVKPIRAKNKREAYRKKWWIYAETRPAMRRAFTDIGRYLATCMVAKHRIFVWLPTVVLPANVVIVFARSDDFFFGILQSTVHRTWAYGQGTQLREKESGDRYTPTTCFETFPFPKPTEAEKSEIADAAKELDRLRSNWLNPPEWTKQEILEFPGTATGPWSRFVENGGASGIGTVRYPRLVPKDEECAKQLEKRTLTNLYNERPTWLDLAHKKLDAAVFAAYGWKAGMSDEEILEALLALNLERVIMKA